MMERTKKTLLDGLEHYGLSVLAPTWPDTVTVQSQTQSDRQLCARSGRGCTSVRITKFNEPLQVDAGGF